LKNFSENNKKHKKSWVRLSHVRKISKKSFSKSTKKSWVRFRHFRKIVNKIHFQKVQKKVRLGSDTSEKIS
jgi:hypothetical protein